MAQVWEAVDHSLGRRVAVKMLHAHLASDPDVLSRFRSEAQSAARLTHPGVVAIYDTVSDGDIEAIVMEMVEGRDLRSILDERGSLAIEDAVEVAVQLAQALGAAHQHGVIHRDVKPANVIVRADRRVKLSDFGIAKALGDTTLTESGSFVGTLKYLAPEQIEGSPVDGRTDLYSLSILLFEMLTGRAPFASEDLVAAMDRIRRPAPRARSIRRDIPPRLDDFLARSLSQDPNDRPADAKAYVAELTAAMRRDTKPDPTRAERPIGGVPAAAAPVAAKPAPRPRSIPMRESTTSGDSPPTPKKRGRRARDIVWPLIAAALMIGAVVVVWMLLRPARDLVTDQLGTGDETEQTTDGNDDSDVETDDDQAETTDDGSEDDGGASGDGSSDSADSSTTSTSSTTTTTTTIPFVEGRRVRAFDPLGDGNERDETAPFAIDGDPTTFWRTEMYNAGRTMGPKEGVGLIIEFDDSTTVNALETLTNNPGWAAALYEADSAADDLVGWGDPLVEWSDLPTDAVLEFPEMTTTAMLLWFTDLGESEEEQPRLELYELVVRP